MTVVDGEHPEIQEAISRSDYQSEFYKELSDSFAKAWPDDSRDADQGAIRYALSLCAEWKKSGKLVSPWDDISNEYTKFGKDNSTYLAALNYSQERQKQTAKSMEIAV